MLGLLACQFSLIHKSQANERSYLKEGEWLLWITPEVVLWRKNTCVSSPPLPRTLRNWAHTHTVP